MAIEISDTLYIYLRTKPLSQNGTNTSSSSSKKPDPESLTVEETKRNPCFPAVHSVVKFHYQSHRGRYAVADEDIEVCKINCSFRSLYICLFQQIKDGSINVMLYAHFYIQVGTTLLRESPITYALHPEKYGTNCQHCFVPIRAVIPCPKCVWVCFCCTECRDAALSTYHRYFHFENVGLQLF